MKARSSPPLWLAAQSGVNAFGHLYRRALAHHQRGHFAQIAQMHLGLARAVLFFRFAQAIRKHLGDVVQDRLQQQQAPVFIFQRVEAACKQLRPDVVVNPARQIGGVYLQIGLAKCVAILWFLGSSELSAWLMRRVSATGNRCNR